MSDSDPSAFSGFGKFVPGFDFLQNLATQAAASAADNTPQLPNLGNWVAPTLNPEELDKRISELKSVQFWLDQNATALKATIQALEVQKMTLATLKGMNFNMGDMANAFKLKVAESVAGGVPDAADKATSFAGLEVPPTSFGKKAVPAKKMAPAAAPAAGVVDPMQWWGALTQQFQSIAADAMTDAAKKAAIQTATASASQAGKQVAKAGRTAMNTALRSAQAWPTPIAAKKTVARKVAAKTARKTSR